MNQQKSIYQIYREKSNMYLENFYREVINNSDKALDFLRLTEKSLLNLLKINEVLIDFLDKMDDNDITLELFETYHVNVSKLKDEFETVSTMYVIDNEPIFDTDSSNLGPVNMNFNSYSQNDNSLFYKIKWTKPKIIVGTGGYFAGFSLITVADARTYYDTDDRSEIINNLTTNSTILENDKESLKDALQSVGQSARDIQSKKNSYEILLNSLLL